MGIKPIDVAFPLGERHDSNFGQAFVRQRKRLVRKVHPLQKATLGREFFKGRQPLRNDTALEEGEALKPLVTKAKTGRRSLGNW